MRKRLLLQGNGVLICYANTGQNAPTNSIHHRFSETGITGKAPAADAPIPRRFDKIAQAQTAGPAGRFPAGSLFARQVVSICRKAVRRWSTPGRVRGIMTGVLPVCCKTNRKLTCLLPAAARLLYNLVNTDCSIITLMHQRRLTYRRRPAYC